MIDKIDIVIVNWCSGQQLKDVFLSIKNFHNECVSSVIIVDNASTDDSLSNIEAIDNFPFSNHIIRNTRNIGFGAACNQGAMMAQSDYILFLNPDTRLHENSLSVSLNFMRQSTNKYIGICGIQLIDDSTHVSRSCARFPTVQMFAAQALGLDRIIGLSSWKHHMIDWDHSSTREVDHVIGAYYLIRRDLFELLKGFDERFFVYLEDLDLSIRARQAGWRTIYLANAQAFHAGGGTSRQVKDIRLFYSLRSRLLYGFKHFSRAEAWMLVIITLLIEPISRFVFSLVRGGPRDMFNTFRGYTMLWQALPSIILKGRRR